jgi:hypothetical protein
MQLLIDPEDVTLRVAAIVNGKDRERHVAAQLGPCDPRQA